MFNIKRMGYNTIHDNNFKVNRPNGYNYFLLLFVKSNSTFIINNQIYDVSPNTIIVYAKNSPHKYMSSNDKYKNDWIHFDCSETLNIPLNTPILIKQHTYIDNLIQTISMEFFSNNTHKTETLNHLMSILFLKINEFSIENTQDKSNPNIDEKLINLRSEIYSNPQLNWSISLMCKKTNLSSGYLQKIYKSSFSVTCMEDVFESRINHAKQLLTGTNLMVYEISSLCGYSSEFHFMKQFKKLTNITPSSYRKQKS